MIAEAVNGFYTQLASAGEVYNTIAPATASPPYITFGLLTESPIGDFSDFEAVENLTFWVNCFVSTSMASAMALADTVMDTLDSASLTASGFTSMKVVREFINSPILDEETQIIQAPLRYRIWLSKD